MSDYSQHQDRNRPGQTPDYYDNVGSGSSTWLWVGILLFAVLALGFAVLSGSPAEDGDGTAAAPELAAPATPEAAPATTEVAPAATE